MTDVQPIPDGYTAITPYLIVENAAGFIDFLINAFGAVERLRVPMPQGGIGHAEVEIDGAALMLADAMPPAFPSTASLIHLYVADTDAVYARALAAGATSDDEPSDMFYGDRLARITDPYGNHWSIATHVEDVTAEELAVRLAAFGNTEITGQS